MLETEIKLKGSKKSLTETFKRFMKLPSDTPTNSRNAHYSFNTYYLDTDDFKIARKGYSLRHRFGVFNIGKQAGTEIKSLDGVSEYCSEASVRTEIGVRGCSVEVNVERLRNACGYLFEELSFDDLKIQFATACRRLEHSKLCRLPGTGKVLEVEAALDDMETLVRIDEELSPSFPLSTSSIFNRTVLFPFGEVEHELEFELKGTYDERDVKPLFDYLISSGVIDTNSSSFTSTSKARRVLDRLNLKL